MTEDPIVEEVRHARAELFAKFDNDLDALVRHLQQKTTGEQRAGRQVLSMPPRKPDRRQLPVKKVG